MTDIRPFERDSGAYRRELPSLTPIRGIAALWVVFYHYSINYLPNLDSSNYTHFVAKGYLAVDMFFILSGFVMAHVYSASFTNGIAQHFGSFLGARIARLYPLHLLVLLSFVLTALIVRLIEYLITGSYQAIPLEGVRSWNALIANIFMLQGVAAGKLSWNYPAWSISVEFMAYLLFPLLLLTVWRAPNLAKLVLAVLLAAALGWLVYLTNDNFDQWNGPRTLLRCLPEFAAGTLLYHFFESAACRRFMSNEAVAFGTLAVTILCLHLGSWDIVTVLLFPVFILAAVTNTGYFTVLINSRVPVWLGEISYSLYLIHGFVQYITTQALAAVGIDRSDLATGRSLGLMIIMVAVSMLAASMTYRRVEVVGRRYLRTVLAGTRPTGSGPQGHALQVVANPVAEPKPVGNQEHVPVKHAVGANFSRSERKMVKRFHYDRG
jgi:peptidoglycan/LPS O-acetylase OafA/YrhL